MSVMRITKAELEILIGCVQERAGEYIVNIMKYEGRADPAFHYVRNQEVGLAVRFEFFERNGIYNIDSIEVTD